MSAKLTDYINKAVLVITQDGRTIVGNLKGFDQTTNIILAESTERVFSQEEAMEEVPLGLYVVRGDNVVTIGEIDTDLDGQIDWSKVRADAVDEARL